MTNLIDNIVYHILQFENKIERLSELRLVSKQFYTQAERIMNKLFERYKSEYKLGFSNEIIVVGKGNQLFILFNNFDFYGTASNNLFNLPCLTKLNFAFDEILSGNWYFTKIDGIPEGYLLEKVNIFLKGGFLTFIDTKLKKKVIFSFGSEVTGEFCSTARPQNSELELTIATTNMYRSILEEEIKILEVLDSSRRSNTSILLTSIGLVLTGINIDTDIHYTDFRFFADQSIEELKKLYVSRAYIPPILIEGIPLNDIKNNIKKVSVNEIYLICLLNNGELFGCGCNYQAMGFRTKKVRTVLEKIFLPNDFVNDRIIDIAAIQAYSFLLLKSGKVLCFDGREYIRDGEWDPELNNNDNYEVKYFLFQPVTTDSNSMKRIFVCDSNQSSQDFLPMIIIQSDDNKVYVSELDFKNNIPIKLFYETQNKSLFFTELEFEANKNKKINNVEVINGLLAITVQEGNLSYMVFFSKGNFFHKLPFPKDLKNDIKKFTNTSNDEESFNPKTLYECYQNPKLLAEENIKDCSINEIDHVFSINKFQLNKVRKEVNLSKGITPLMIASKEGEISLFNSLVEALTREQINVQDFNGNTALHYAVSSSDTYNHDQEKKVEKLISLGADVTIKNQEGITPLMIDSKGELFPLFHCLDEDVIKQQINVQDFNGNTALHHTVLVLSTFNHYQAKKVEDLISLGADVTIKNQKGQTALMILADTMIKNQDGITPLMFASSVKESLSLFLILSETVIREEINVQDFKGNTALHYAVSSTSNTYNYDQEKKVEKLISLGADVTIKNQDGITPLMVAAKRRGQFCFEILSKDVTTKEHINDQDFKGNTALHYAVEEDDDSEEICFLRSLIKENDILEQVNKIKRLISLGADITIKNQDGITPLMLAVMRRKFFSILRIISIIDMTEYNDDIHENKGILHYSAYHGYENIIKILIGYGVNPNMQNNLGITPLMYAAMQGHVAAVKVLIGNNFGNIISKERLIMAGRSDIFENDDLLLNTINCHKDITLTAKFDYLSVSTIEGKSIYNKSFWNQGTRTAFMNLLDPSDVNKRDHKQNTALHYAAMYGHKQIIDLLVHKDQIQTLIGEEGKTPLIFSVQNKHPEAVKKLFFLDSTIEYFYHSDHSGHTAIDYAEQNELNLPEPFLNYEVMSKHHPLLPKFSIISEKGIIFSPENPKWKDELKLKLKWYKYLL